MMLGTWQGIYFFEHRRAPHRREIVLHFLGEQLAPLLRQKPPHCVRRMSKATPFAQNQGSKMPELLSPLSNSLTIFFCTFAVAVSGMALRKKLPIDHLSEDSKDVIKLVMGLIATMSALVLSLLIASANSSYEAQSGGLRQVSATIVELDGILAQYGPEINEPRRRLRVAVSSAIDKIWSKEGLRLGQIAPEASHAEVADLYDSITKLSPKTEAQHFIQIKHSK